MEIWDIWYPDAAAQGLSFCRARIEPVSQVLVHAAPSVLRVEVRSESGHLLASAQDLARAGDYVPMTRLRRVGNGIVKEDEWPFAGDIGQVVLLAGGEAAMLQAWWHAEDHSEWRWSVEFYNRRESS